MTLEKCPNFFSGSIYGKKIIKNTQERQNVCVRVYNYVN